MIGGLAGPMGQVAARERGRSSGVEHNLAKVGVEGSNPFARSSFAQYRTGKTTPGRAQVFEQGVSAGSPIAFSSSKQSQGHRAGRTKGYRRRRAEWATVPHSAADPPAAPPSSRIRERSCPAAAGDRPWAFLIVQGGEFCEYRPQAAMIDGPRQHRALSRPSRIWRYAGTNELAFRNCQSCTPKFSLRVRSGGRVLFSHHCRRRALGSLILRNRRRVRQGRTGMEYICLYRKVTCSVSLRLRPPRYWAWPC